MQKFHALERKQIRKWRPSVTEQQPQSPLSFSFCSSPYHTTPHILRHAQWTRNSRRTSLISTGASLTSWLLKGVEQQSARWHNRRADPQVVARGHCCQPGAIACDPGSCVSTCSLAEALDSGGESCFEYCCGDGNGARTEPRSFSAVSRCRCAL